MKLIVKKELSGFIPMSESYEDFNSIKQNEILSCEIKRPRNIQFHRKYFALLNIAYENRQILDNMTFDQFRKEIIKRSGFYDEYRDFLGMMIYDAKSISFAKMKADEFEELYSRSINVILKYILVGMKDEELRKSVNLIIGF